MIRQGIRNRFKFTNNFGPQKMPMKSAQVKDIRQEMAGSGGFPVTSGSRISKSEPISELETDIRIRVPILVR